MERLGLSNKYSDWKSPERPDRPGVAAPTPSNVLYKTEDEAVNMEVGDISISGEQGLMDERKTTTRAAAGEGEQVRGTSSFLKGFKTYSTAVESTSSVLPKSKQSTYNPQRYEKREDSTWLMDFLKSIGGGTD